MESVTSTVQFHLNFRISWRFRFVAVPFRGGSVSWRFRFVAVLFRFRNSAEPCRCWKIKTLKLWRLSWFLCWTYRRRLVGPWLFWIAGLIQSSALSFIEGSTDFSRVVNPLAYAWKLPCCLLKGIGLRNEGFYLRKSFIEGSTDFSRVVNPLVYAWKLIFCLRRGIGLRNKEFHLRKEDIRRKGSISALVLRRIQPQIWLEDTKRWTQQCTNILNPPPQSLFIVLLITE